jgi:hypothetical protein
MDGSMKILEKFKDLAKYTYVVLQQFPKSEKYTLAAHTRSLLWDMGTKLKRASIISNIGIKKRLIEQVDENNSCLNFLIEMGLELHFVNPQKFGVFCENFAEVGKMIGGWLKWVNQKEKAAYQ